MKHITLFLGLLLSVMGSLLAQSELISGTLRDEVTYQPLGNVTIKVKNTLTQTFIDSTRTNESGYFQIAINSRTVVFVVEAPNYQLTTTPLPNIGNYLTLTVRPEGVLSHSDIKIKTKESLSGTFTHTAAAPTEISVTDIGVISSSKSGKTKSMPMDRGKKATSTKTEVLSGETRPSPPPSPALLLGGEDSKTSTSGDVITEGESDAWEGFDEGAGSATEKKILYEEAIMAAEEADKAEEAEKRELRSTKAPAKLLTAGEIHDFSKWNLWNDLTENELKSHEEEWILSPKVRYAIQLETPQHKPIVDATVQLLNVQKEVVWTARTDNTGKAEMWKGLFPTPREKGEKFTISVSYKGKNATFDKIKPFDKGGINILTLAADCDMPTHMDVAFVVDATGSMGDEIEYLKAELKDILLNVKDSLPNITLNTASVFYRDFGDDYVTVASDFSKDIAKTVSFVEQQYAGGGGDTPEAVEEALKKSIVELSWSDHAVAKIIFLILDAPPHNTPVIQGKLQELMAIAAAKGIRIVPVTCSGIDKSTEYLMRTFALATNGTYVFLTDDSGIGGSHIKPSTDKFSVELLNHVMMRLMYQFSSTPECEIPIQTLTKPDTLQVINPHIEPQDTLHPDKDPQDALISWKYYPNPTTGIIEVEIYGKSTALFVSDISGKTLQRYETNGESRITLDITEFPDGVYFIRYEYEPNKWLSGKVILTHR